MELEKTTLLSVIVWTAGLMAEIVFHDALSESIFGLVLGIIIAVIVIVATYFIVDGVGTDLKNKREEAWDRQAGYYEKKFQMLSSRLDEQIRLEKSVYDKLDDILVISRGQMERAAESMFASPGDGGVKSGSGVSSTSGMTLEEAVEMVNAKTLDSAKIIAKHQMKTTKELKVSLDLILDELSEKEKSKGDS